MELMNDTPITFGVVDDLPIFFITAIETMEVTLKVMGKIDRNLQQSPTKHDTHLNGNIVILTIFCIEKCLRQVFSHWPIWDVIMD